MTARERREEAGVRPSEPVEPKKRGPGRPANELPVARGTQSIQQSFSIALEQTTRAASHIGTCTVISEQAAVREERDVDSTPIGRLPKRARSSAS